MFDTELFELAEETPTLEGVQKWLDMGVQILSVKQIYDGLQQL